MRQKVAALIVRLRIPLMILMLILAVLCGTTIRSVKVNYDLISYLDDDTAAMRGLAIMNCEFSGVSGMSVALKNGTEEDAQQTASWIAALDGVMLANHDAETGVKEHDGGTYRLIRVIANADNSDAVYDAHCDAGFLHNRAGGAAGHVALLAGAVHLFPYYCRIHIAQYGHQLDLPQHFICNIRCGCHPAAGAGDGLFHHAD